MPVNAVKHSYQRGRQSKVSNPAHASCVVETHWPVSQPKGSRQVPPDFKSAAKAQRPAHEDTSRNVWENKVVRVLRILNFCTYVNNSVLFIILSYYYYGALSEGTVVV